MPRQATVPLQLINMTLLSFKNDILKDINRTSADTWIKISDAFAKLMSPKSIYTYIRTNKNSCWDILDINEYMITNKD
ncbi:unnamed protein product [Gordionus sp. m RMFG-2023]